MMNVTHRSICMDVYDMLNGHIGSICLQVVKNLLKKPNAKAVVLFTRAEDAK